MSRTNASWQRLSNEHKWIVRIVVLLLAIVNGWAGYEHVVARNTVIAVTDGLFVALCLGFIYQSF